MDSIIDQMMTVAEYIGWETKELRPVSNLLEINGDITPGGGNIWPTGTGHIWPAKGSLIALN